MGRNGESLPFWFPASAASMMWPRGQGARLPGLIGEIWNKIENSAQARERNGFLFK